MRNVPFLSLVAILILSACTAPAATTTVPTTVSPTVESFITISHPPEELVTAEAEVKLQGTVTEEVVLSVNEEIHILPPGAFDIPLALEPGVNVFEIVASTYAGDTFEIVLVVTCEP